MPTRVCIFAVPCAAVVVLVIMSNRFITETASNSTRVEVLYDPADVRINLTENVKSGKQDTAPFNKSSLIPPFLHFRAIMEVLQLLQSL
ncbi:unnamed protein product [Cylicocyclus nassatus]|uniref:Uncharacterized protein n=1 Tax=Cylicocyclus nassatus TaxID=53992 RepID=A0AA36GBY2_CYLNA|nr:unnamed protein product [Cylicocyclus nassatus]